MKTPKTDPMLRTLRKAYRSTSQSVLDRLKIQESKWKRKQTIARNKLEEVRAEITALTEDLCRRELAPETRKEEQ